MGNEEAAENDSLKATVDPADRRRAKRHVHETLKLQEFGDESTAFADSRTGMILARGYVRVVYDYHGAYVECRADQVIWQSLEAQEWHPRYDLYRCASPGHAEVYFHREAVDDRPHLSAGMDCESDSRSEGLADFKPGLAYLVVQRLTVSHEGAGVAHDFPPPTKERPHDEVLREALSRWPCVKVLEASARNVRIQSSGKHRRFARPSPEAVAEAAGVHVDCCMRAMLWMADGRPAAKTLFPRHMQVDLVGLQRLCDQAVLRPAQDRHWEAAHGTNVNEVLIPLHPELHECPLYVSPAVMELPILVFNARCGVLAAIAPRDLEAHFGAIVCSLEATPAEKGGGGRSEATGSCRADAAPAEEEEGGGMMPEAFPAGGEDSQRRMEHLYRRLVKQGYLPWEALDLLPSRSWIPGPSQA